MKSIKTEFGTAWLNTAGYYCVSKSNKGKVSTEMLHILIYEKHFGPIQEGLVIHHKDGSKINNNIDNLEAMTQRDHVRVHSGWVGSGGIWTHKPCSLCKEIKPLADFSTRKSRYKTKGKDLIDFCRACGRIKSKKWSDKNRVHVRKKAMENYYKRLGRKLT